MLVNCSTNDGKTVVILDATKLLEKACQKLRGFFFPSNAFMASARSFNTFNCMFQIRLQELISAYTWPSAD